MFISFEGIDASGKSRQIKMLAEYLQNAGYDVIITREPGGCDISEKIRDILLDTQHSHMQAHAEALLYAAARVQIICEVIRPALNDGKIVLCDRFYDSSVAYQVYGRGLPMEFVANANEYAIQNCMPDLTFFVDVTPQMAEQRMKPDRVKDRLEQEEHTFFDKVYNGFLQICKDNARIKLIDASGQKADTHQKIVEEFECFINKNCSPKPL